jgi:hypothetical protein
LLVFHANINEMNGSRSKIPTKNFRPYIYDVKFLALLGAPHTHTHTHIYIYIYDLSKLRVKYMYNLSFGQNSELQKLHAYM